MFSEKMDETLTWELHTLDGTITQSLQSPPNPRPPTQSAILSSAHPGVSHQTQNLGTPMSDLGSTIHENQNEWQIPSLESEIVIPGGSNLGMESKIEINWPSVECHSFPGVKLALQKCLQLPRKLPYDTRTCYPCGKWSQDYKRPPSTRVWGPESVSRGQNILPQDQHTL